MTSGRDGAVPYVRARLEADGVRLSGRMRARFGQERTDSHGRRNGVFWRWRAEDDRVTLANDHLGMAPLFYCAGDEEFLASPSLAKLLELGAPRELDVEAICVFLRLGWYLEEDTPFRRIKVLPPGATLVWRAGRLSLERGEVVRGEAAIGYRAALEGYIELFRQAVARLSEPDEASLVPLSGGADSRHILLELCRQGRAPRSAATVVRWRTGGDQDWDCAARLARAAGVEHVALAPSRRYAREELLKNRLTGFLSDEHTFLNPIRRYALGRFDRLYDGIGGDVLSAGLYIDRAATERCRAGDYAPILPQVFRYDGSLDFLARRLFGIEADVEAVARERVARNLERWREAANPLGMFYLMSRTRREVAAAPFGLFAAIGRVQAPYLDRDLYDHLASVPAEHLWDHDFHRAAIRAAYPEHAELPYAAGGAGPSAAQKASAALQLVAFAARRSPGAAAGLARLVARASRGSGAQRFNWRTAFYLVQLAQLRDSEQPPEPNRWPLTDEPAETPLAAGAA